MRYRPFHIGHHAFRLSEILLSQLAERHTASGNPARAAEDRNWTTLSSRGDFDSLRGHDAVVTRVLSSRRVEVAQGRCEGHTRKQESGRKKKTTSKMIRQTEQRANNKEAPSQRAGNFEAIIMSGGAHTLALTLPSRQAQPLPPPPRASVAFMQSSGACKKAQGVIHK